MESRMQEVTAGTLITKEIINEKTCFRLNSFLLKKVGVR